MWKPEVTECSPFFHSRAIFCHRVLATSNEKPVTPYFNALVALYKWYYFYRDPLFEFWEITLHYAVIYIQTVRMILTKRIDLIAWQEWFMRLESSEFTASTTAIFVKNAVSYVPNADSFRRKACTRKSIIWLHSLELQ